MIVEQKLQFAEAYQHHGYRISDIANTLTAGGNSSVRGDTSLVIENKAVCFDDFVENEDGSRWAYICKDCVKKYGISKMFLDNDCSGGICGVKGCENEADYYIDFPEEAGGPEEIVYRIRRLTPTECERLDGFPDGWTKYDTKGNLISDNNRYTALGNSIAVPCAERVFRGIIAAEEAEVAAVAKSKDD